MNANRTLWNQGQQKLRRALTLVDHQKAIDQFLVQHARVHSSNGEHSIAWIIFHIARIEDITMNMLVAGTPQLFLRDNWADKLKVAMIHSANKMDETEVAILSTKVDIDALRSYRQSVGRRTRAIVRKLKPEEFRQKVAASRLQKVMDEGALLPEAIEILNYWSKRTIAGLLLMPPTRHNFLQ